jgi:glycosyltransferase involved in cell wall biosynthesis
MQERRIAIVVQRYGEEVNGGAELSARWLAEHLLDLAEVHVITSCALEYMTWADHYPPGESCLNGVHLHRFPVDRPRDWARFQKLTRELFAYEHSTADELAWVRQQGPYSTPLLNYIKNSAADYDLFIFFTYLYASTFFGLPMVADKAILLPAAHEEPFLYLPIYRDLFHQPQLIVYYTQAEMELINRVTGNAARPQVVVGVGINVPQNVSAERFRQKYGIDEPILLYAGRIDVSKNVPELFAHFIRFRQQYREPLKLVLIGKAYIALPEHADIIHLGFLSEQDKFDAIQAASVVVVPSLYESLSMITLEAWLMEVPVLVNGRCNVLKRQCCQSNGGLYYYSGEEFDVALTMLLQSDKLRRQLGHQGRVFTHKQYQWEVIMAKYRVILEEMAASQCGYRNA